MRHTIEQYYINNNSNKDNQSLIRNENEIILGDLNSLHFKFDTKLNYLKIFYQNFQFDENLFPQANQIEMPCRENEIDFKKLYDTFKYLYWNADEISLDVTNYITFPDILNSYGVASKLCIEKILISHSQDPDFKHYENVNLDNLNYYIPTVLGNFNGIEFGYLYFLNIISSQDEILMYIKDMHDNMSFYKISIAY